MGCCPGTTPWYSSGLGVVPGTAKVWTGITSLIFSQMTWFEIQFIAIMAHYKWTASATTCASHLRCEFQRMWPLQWHASHLFHIMWILHKNAMSHIRRLYASQHPLFHAVCPFLTVSWWACPLCASTNPNSFVSFGLMKECVASLSNHETLLPLIRAMMYKRFGLGLRLLALATNSPSNIWSAATTWFGLVRKLNF